MNKKKTLYEITFAVLAVVAVSLAATDLLNQIPSSYQNLYFFIDKIILIIFAADYFYWLYKAEDKKKYIKNNIFELLSIIPLDSFFRGFRIFRIIRLIRVFILAKRLTKRSRSFLKTNGFIYVAVTAVVIVFLGAVAIYMLEAGTTMKSFGDSLWWSFVTCTTVGYGDLSPHTGAGMSTPECF